MHSCVSATFLLDNKNPKQCQIFAGNSDFQNMIWYWIIQNDCSFNHCDQTIAFICNCTIH